MTDANYEIDAKCEELISEIITAEHDFLNFDKIILNFKLIETLNSAYDTIIVIGFGASKLNIAGLITAAKVHAKKIIYIDDLDQEKLDQKLSEINNIARAVFFSVSKSGNTQETYILTKYILSLHNINSKKMYIVCPSGQNLLYKLAHNYQTNHIEHEVKGSGRFGIIVGTNLAIAHAMGVNSNAFLTSVKMVLKDRLVNKQKIIDLASWYLQNYDDGRKIFVTLDYTSRMKYLIDWQSQLIAESLGKQGFGITPISSNGTFDEHSYLQLYVEGPDDKFYNLFIEKDVDNAFWTAKEAHFNKICSTLKSTNRPISSQVFDKINEEIVAEFIIDSILTTMLVAKCKNIDPFSQPAVDNCKIIV